MQCTAKVNLRRISAIGTTGQMRGLTLLDRSGNVVRNSILWNDLRCEKEVNEIKNGYAELIKRVTHNPLNTMCTLPKVLWIIRNEPEIWKRAVKFIFPKDYINFRLTGNLQTDLSDASGTSLYNIEKQTWSDEILEQFSLTKDKLPNIYFSTTIIGELTAKAAEETGLKKGLPVVAGGSDAVVELLAIGIKSANQCKLRLGTSGALSTVVNNIENLPDKNVYCWSYVLPNIWVLDINTRTCAHAIVWLRDVFFKDKPKIVETYRYIEQEARSVSVGSEGLFFHPYLLGEDAPYWDPKIKASFFGCTITHKRSHYARAVLEGTAYALRDARLIFGNRAQDFSEYILVGGGVKNALWVSIVTDVLGIDGKISTKANASMGAAMLAGIGIEVFNGLDDAIKTCVKINRYVKYNRENHKVYSELFDRYREMKKIYDRIYELDHQ